LKLEELLERAVREGASDIFIKAGAAPVLRVAGNVMPLYSDVISEFEVADYVEHLANEQARGRLAEHGEIDLAYELDPLGRFRVNIFRQRGRMSMVMRVIKSRIPPFDELNLPSENLKKLASLPRGLVLVTGIAGSGKSTTIASMLEYVNENFAKHIVTVEDPIEYVFQDKRSIFDQREIGHDTGSYSTALKHVVRQSPDIIMLGEMRDSETMEAAMHAAETGHLVFSTLHTPNAMQSVDRIMNFFPPHSHNFLRMQMSQLLEGVVSQRLIPTKDMTNRVPAIEIMMATPTIRELLVQGKSGELYKATKQGKYFGCMTFNQSLKALLDSDLITVEDAINNADSPEELRLELRGISRDSGF
jgi:twitching motility protein PilT